MGRLNRNTRDLSIIIPAAGIGRRMKSYGPKPLIELSGFETVLSRQLRILRETFPKADIVVVVGYEAERIIRTLPLGMRLKVVENERYDETNVLRSIGMGLRAINHTNVMVIYGDLVFNSEAVTWATSNGSSLLVDTKGQIDEEEVGTTVVDGRVTNLSYGLDTKWSQIMYLTGRELDLFKRMAWNSDRRMWFGYEALNMVVDNGGNLRAIEPRGVRVAEIDSSKDIERARAIIT
jgi:choline kinase